MAAKLAEAFPHLIHIEETSFIQPDYHHHDQMYGDKYYDYSNNYCVHLYSEKNFFIPANEEELQGYNCTLGRIMRDVLYGDPQLRDTVNVRNGLLKKRKTSK